MLVKFNDNNESTTFIKSLVTATPLSVYNCIQDGDKIIKGCYYIYHGYLIRCESSGILERRLSDLAPGKAYVNLDDSAFIVIKSIPFGGYVTNVTRKETCPNSYYDYDTHRLLGKYLRQVRSYYGIDLMHLYNVFDGSTVEDIYINDNEDYYFTLAKNNKYKVMFVPVKFNTKYTIYLDSSTSIKMCPVFRDRTGPIKIEVKRDNTARTYIKENIIEEDSESQDITDIFNPIKREVLTNISFNNPFVWEGITCDTKDLYELENYFGLLIQVDSNNTSSLVVLEGDKSKNSRYIFNAQNEAILMEEPDEPIDDRNKRLPSRRKGVVYLLNELTQQEFNDLFRTPKQLTLVNDKTVYAFNDKLIPYLLHHVITNMEMIEKNIGRVQKYLPNKNEYEDIWNNRLRIDAYNKYLSDYEATKFDVDGFIDPDIERYINKYKERIIK